MRRSIATSVLLTVIGAFCAYVPAAMTSAAALTPPLRAYVLHGASPATAIDTATRTVAGSVALGAPSSQIAFSPDGTRGYVSTPTTDSVSVIDTASDAVVATIAVGDEPTALAVSPDGTRLYVMLAGGIVQAVDTATRAVVRTITVGGTGGIAVTPDGSRLYVAAGSIYAVDLATGTVITSFAPAPSNYAQKIVISPDGASAYVTASAIFTGIVVRIDLATNTVAQTFPEFRSLPGDLAIAPDGSRVYVGRAATFVNTGYGAGFFPGRTVAVLDTQTNTWISEIDLGATGTNYTQQNTASGIGVTPDRTAVYISVPRLSYVAVADFNTNVVTTTIPVVAGPGELGIVPNPSATTVPYVVDAVNDSAMSTTLGGPAVANVIANDHFGGAPATFDKVTLSQLSTTSARIALDPATGAVNVGAGAPVATHTLAYRICEIAHPSNCDDATVTIALRASYMIDAVADSTTTLAARVAIDTVLANDTLNGVTATPTTVRLTQVSSTSATILLSPANGSVWVFAGTPAGSYTLRYRICEIASPVNCDTTDVALTVLANPIDAVNDTGITTRSGGTAIGNVLTNDTLTGTAATLAWVTLAQVSSTSAQVALSPATGAIAVAAGAPVGTYSVVYRMCEKLVASNCDVATASVTVNPYLIDAVNDVVAKASSKTPGVLLANVLANDRFTGVVATLAKVTLTQVSTTNADIRLVPTTGAVQLLRKTASTPATLVYRICETANPTNCDQASVTINLSGSA